MTEVRFLPGAEVLSTNRPISKGSPMKIPPATVEAMRALIAPLDTDEVRARYVAGDFPRSDLTKDLNRRYRWDLLWASGAYNGDEFNGYKNDWIDTALRRIVPVLVR
jgi:hypothetical protein